MNSFLFSFIFYEFRLFLLKQLFPKEADFLSPDIRFEKKKTDDISQPNCPQIVTVDFLWIQPIKYCLQRIMIYIIVSQPHKTNFQIIFDWNVVHFSIKNKTGSCSRKVKIKSTVLLILPEQYFWICVDIDFSSDHGTMNSWQYSEWRDNEFYRAERVLE